MARVRIGPLSYGPKGQRGIHTGPFSASYNTRSPIFGAFMLLVVIVAIAKAIWPVLLLVAVVVPVALLATKGRRQEQAAAAQRRRVEQAAAAQQLRTEQEAVEAKTRAEAQQRWLEGPPPTLYVPRRFSEGWFADNVPKLHPGQLAPLRDEMLARGWTDERIARRLGRYLEMNPFLRDVWRNAQSTASASVDV